jgi:hypothetical protein
MSEDPTMFIVHFPGGAACVPAERVREMVARVVPNAATTDWTSLMAAVNSRRDWAIEPA